MHSSFIILACLFRKKGRSIVIARSSSLSSLCKNFNVAHYSKCIKGINTKLGILACLIMSPLQSSRRQLLWKITGGISSKLYRNDQSSCAVVSIFQFNDFLHSNCPLKILKFIRTNSPKVLMQFEWNFTGLITGSSPCTYVTGFLIVWFLAEFWPFEKKSFSCSFLQK